MLCESILWSMTFCPDQERLVPLQPVIEPTGSSETSATQTTAAPPVSALQASPGHPSSKCHSILPRVSENQNPSSSRAQIQPQASPPLPALCSGRPRPGRHISPQMEIPGQACSGGEVPFLVPSSCQSICQNYSDLHIGGDQVLPLLGHDGDLLPCRDPFLYSCDVPPAEDSPPAPASEDEHLHPLRRRSGSSRCKGGSGRVRSFLLQGRQGPLSNSLLNRYLEHKLLDLYQQYMLESMTRDAGLAGADLGLPGSLLASELIMTSLDQITQQLSREGHVEAGRAKDMVLSCFRRVASGLTSSEISTPLLQISTDVQLPTHGAPTATNATTAAYANATTAGNANAITADATTAGDANATTAADATTAGDANAATAAYANATAAGNDSTAANANATVPRISSGTV
ncbi:protein CXorf21 homolog [Esox lucius]|uniref:Uncharacterized protein n=1 Tax=Esox lucius TaxID=8010 RepID=A0AAY5L4L0_ESOLU|nr:protein CXorf21 homolog [Esox lucius]